MQDILELTPVMMHYSRTANIGLVMDPTTDLDTMADRALECWPTLAYKKGGSRAHKAVTLVEKNAVVFLGETNTGMDTWMVGDHFCSLTGKTCRCEDSLAPIDGKYGRLCKHRLAVYFQVAMDRLSLRRLERVLSRADSEVVLEVQVYYRNDLHLQISNLVGVRSDGGTWQRWGQADQISFRVADLATIMFRFGWKIAPGRRLVVGRHYGGRERWFLERMENSDYDKGSRIGTAVESLYGRDVAMVEDYARERRFGEMFRDGLERTAA